MRLNTIRQRLARTDPVVLDMVLALGLAVLVCVQIWLVSQGRPGRLPMPPNARFVGFGRGGPDFFSYALAASVFLPLALRRSLPWLSLLLAGMAAVAYQLLPNPPAFVILGPMIALYSLAAYSSRRHAGLLALLVAGVIFAVPVFAFSSSIRWVAELVGSFVLVAASALLGEAERNRREYIAEVEGRAAEAERSREEEALRRVDEERIRIAREVHDIVAHSLSIVTVQAGAAEALLAAGDATSARESVANVRATGKQALAELRSMLDVLRTGEGNLPLGPANDISDAARLVEPLRDSGLDVRLELTGDLGAVPAYASVSAYRIVQEALTNIMRHAHASHARVRVDAGPHELVIEVTDDGRGPAASAPAEAPGHGIRGMRERVDALGGVFSAEAGTTGGFRVYASIPVSRSTT